MSTDEIKDGIAKSMQTQRWVTHDWTRLRDALDSLPADELLRMGKGELRDAINRILLEKEAVASGVASALASGVL